MKPSIKRLCVLLFLFIILNVIINIFKINQFLDTLNFLTFQSLYFTIKYRLTVFMLYIL